MPSAILLRGGTLVPVDPGYPAELTGDLLIRGTRIAGIGPGIQAGPDTEVIDVTGSIVIPGLVDTHRHTWQSLVRLRGADWTLADYGPAMFGRYGPRYRSEDMAVAIRLGLAEALDAGITQLLDWNHNLESEAHLEASLRAHRASGMRLILGIGESTSSWLTTYGPSADGAIEGYLAFVRRIHERHDPGQDGLLSLALAPRGPEKAPMDAVDAQWRLARELGLRISVHVGNGLNGAGRAVARLHEAGLMGDDTTYIHTNTLADDEIAMIGSTGGTASAAPAVEASMGHGPSAIRRLREAGVTTGLSVDTCTSAAGDLFGVMRAALLLIRTAEHERRLAAGEPATTMPVRAADALAMATLHGAVTNGTGAETGSLTVGKQADIVVLAADRPNLVPTNDATAAVVLAAHPGNVDSVFVAGRRVKAGGVLLDVDLRELGALAREAAARIAGLPA